MILSGRLRDARLYVTEGLKKYELDLKVVQRVVLVSCGSENAE